MHKSKMNEDPADRAGRESKGRFAPDRSGDRESKRGESHEGRSQGGNGLSQKHDRMEEVYRKGGRSE